MLAAVLNGCGSISDTSPTSTPDANRYFGDNPGQEATQAAIDRSNCRQLQRAVEREAGDSVRVESEPSPPSSRCVLSGRGVRVSVYRDRSA